MVGPVGTEADEKLVANDVAIAEKLDVKVKMAQRLAVNQNLRGSGEKRGRGWGWIQESSLGGSCITRTYRLWRVGANLGYLRRYGRGNKRDRSDFERTSDDDEKIANIFVLGHPLMEQLGQTFAEEDNVRLDHVFR